MVVKTFQQWRLCRLRNGSVQQATEFQNGWPGDIAASFQWLVWAAFSDVPNCTGPRLKVMLAV
jgi:hypothetical protein